MLFSGKIRFHDVVRLTARCVLFATICHYSPLFTTIRDYSHYLYYSRLFAVRYSRLFAIQVFQIPDDNSIMTHKLYTGHRFVFFFKLESIFQLLLYPLSRSHVILPI